MLGFGESSCRHLRTEHKQCSDLTRRLYRYASHVVWDDARQHGHLCPHLSLCAWPLVSSPSLQAPLTTPDNTVCHSSAPLPPTSTLPIFTAPRYTLAIRLATSIPVGRLEPGLAQPILYLARRAQHGASGVRKWPVGVPGADLLDGKVRHGGAGLVCGCSVARPRAGGCARETGILDEIEKESA